MFERYSERARRVVFFARYEASFFTFSDDQQLSSRHIETEHILLGILREEKRMARRYLGSYASVKEVEKEVSEHIVSRERISTKLDIPLTKGSKRVLAYAWEEADKLGHKQIRSKHLLVGLLREEKCLATQILEEHGLKLKQVRDELASETYESRFRTMLAKKFGTVDSKTKQIGRETQ